MTKRRVLIAELEKAGFEQVKSGSTANHDKYRLGDVTVAVPRHREIKDRLADVIRKQAGLR